VEITSSEIRQFQQLYRTKFGIELDDKTARHKLLNLVGQMYVVYRQITPEQLAAYNTSNENVNENTKYEQTRAASDS
jgi:UDP-3-O-acyl-N-acetylglucosamine deacetylase